MAVKKPFKVVSPSSLKAAYCENHECHYLKKNKKPRVLFKRNMTVLEIFCPACQTKHVYLLVPEGYRIQSVEAPAGEVDKDTEKMVKLEQVPVPLSAIELLSR
jgi:hypothetical protein